MLFNSISIFASNDNFIDNIENIQQGPPFFFTAGNYEVLPGEEVCIDVTVADFTNVLSFQYGIEFDPTVLEFVNATSSVLSSAEFFVSLPVNGQPILTASWGSLQAAPLSVSDDSVLFSLCFKAVGNATNCSSIHFTQPTSGAAISLATNVLEYGEDDIEFTDGEICILVADLEVELTAFDADTDGTDTGSLLIEISGGIAPYMVIVEDCNSGTVFYGPSSATGPFVTVFNLPAGKYCVTVVDNNSPSDNAMAMEMINTCNLPNLLEFAFDQIMCNGDLYTNVECVTEAAIPPINSYTWSNGTDSYSGNPIQNVEPGEYYVTISDAIGCSTLELVTLTEPMPFELDEQMSYFRDPVCNGDNNGIISLFVNGGTAPYTYTLDNGVSLTGGGNVIFDQLTWGSYVVSIEDDNGCTIDDRSYTLENPSFIVQTIQASICPGEDYEGYTNTGTYTDVLTNADGCDSVRTIVLTVQEDSTFLNITICNGEEYNGYDSSGNYVETLISSVGCDSVVVLDLEVIFVEPSTIETSICEDEEYEGYTESGTYEDVFTSEVGCDSTRILILEVFDNPNFTVTDTICEGQLYEGYGTTGIYEDVFESSQGCDSTRTLNLTVLPEDDPECLMDNISELAANELLSIMPNPASDFVTFEDAENVFNHIEIIDVAGKLWSSFELINIKSLDISLLPRGMYLIKASTDKAFITQKFVIQ